MRDGQLKIFDCVLDTSRRAFCIFRYQSQKNHRYVETAHAVAVALAASQSCSPR